MGLRVLRVYGSGFPCTTKAPERCREVRFILRGTSTLFIALKGVLLLRTELSEKSGTTRFQARFRVSRAWSLGFRGACDSRARFGAPLPSKDVTHILSQTLDPALDPKSKPCLNPILGSLYKTAEPQTRHQSDLKLSVSIRTLGLVCGIRTLIIRIRLRGCIVVPSAFIGAIWEYDYSFFKISRKGRCNSRLVVPRMAVR